MRSSLEGTRERDTIVVQRKREAPRPGWSRGVGSQAISISTQDHLAELR